MSTPRATTRTPVLHPALPAQIDEEEPTMRPNRLDPDSRLGYGANKVAAEETLLDSGFPVTILRPSKPRSTDQLCELVAQN